MHDKLLETALDITAPWFVAAVRFDEAGKPFGFTRLFEALVLMLARQMPCAAAARIVLEGDLQ